MRLNVDDDNVFLDGHSWRIVATLIGSVIFICSREMCFCGGTLGIRRRCERPGGTCNSEVWRESEKTTVA